MSGLEKNQTNNKENNFHYKKRSYVLYGFFSTIFYFAFIYFILMPKGVFYEKIGPFLEKKLQFILILILLNIIIVPILKYLDSKRNIKSLAVNDPIMAMIKVMVIPLVCSMLLTILLPIVGFILFIIICSVGGGC